MWLTVIFAVAIGSVVVGYVVQINMLCAVWELVDRVSVSGEGGSELSTSSWGAWGCQRERLLRFGWSPS